ncbi:MAG: hypothetical protein ABSH13_19145 [Candidatus Acidiferrum sp.]|jgi:hypothetical protein
MAKKKAAPKKLKKKKAPKAAAKRVAKKAKVSASAKNKAVAKAKAAAPKKAPVKSKTAPKKTPPSTQATVARGSQDVETVRLKPKSRVARAGTGAGDLQGISIVEDVDSESADELLEEGQAFEAGIVSGVERAGDAEGSEVITHEVLEDDVPKEYDDEDRP